MQILRNKTKTATIVMVIMLVMTALIVIVPTINAVDIDEEIDTYAYISVVPNPIGVSQEVTVTMFIDKMPPRDVPGGDDPIGYLKYQNYTLEITAPDGTITTKGPYESDYISTNSLKYTPDQIGTYGLKFIFPGNVLTSVRVAGNPVTTDYYKPSSDQTELVVQQEKITEYPPAELPEGYWERPINEENREWSILAGNWLGVDSGLADSSYNATASFNPYTKAPNTPHIVWTKEQYYGGIVGGEYASTAFYTGLSYEEKWVPPNVAIVFGRLYYSKPLSNSGEGGPLVCVDLRTGEEYWQQEGIYMDTAQLFHYDGLSQHGIIPYLWDLGGSNWKMYDAESGELVSNFANATAPPFGIKYTWDKRGNLIAYWISGNTLNMWNSTKALASAPRVLGIDQYRPPLGGTIDWRPGIQWEAPLIDKPGQGLVNIGEDVLIATKGYNVWPPQLQVIGYDAHNGDYLWTFNLTDQMIQRTNYNFGPISDGVFCWFDQAARQWYGFDVYTGTKIWGPTEPYENAWGTYSQSYRGAGHTWVQVGYGKLYATAYDGTVHCYDLQTGNNEWNFQTPASGFETPYGQWPFYGGVTIADGKVYISTNEHSPNSPNWRGGKLYCINAETGEEIWNISGWMPGPVIAEGYMPVLNYYDGQIYCFGKGLTKTTVTAPEACQPLGTPVLIKGTVTDQSPGDTCLGIPAAGTPAIADEYMSEWMEYLYMQKPIAMNAMGVEVSLEAIDPNGDWYEIGKVTSDANGMFKMTWEPPVEGEYTILANFVGTESYWSSYAETAISVTEAPSPAVPIEPEPTEPTAEAPLITTEIAIIAAVAIASVIGIAAYWALRKRR